MKNELIIAQYTGSPKGDARQRLEEILSSLNLQALSQRFLYIP